MDTRSQKVEGHRSPTPATDTATDDDDKDIIDNEYIRRTLNVRAPERICLCPFI